MSVRSQEEPDFCIPNSFREKLDKTYQMIEDALDGVILDNNGVDNMSPSKSLKTLIDDLQRSQTPMTSKLHPNHSSRLELSGSVSKLRESKTPSVT
jgi:phosphate uptake regulator